MIESNIVKWIDLGDSMQHLDVYGKRKWVKFFNIIRVLITFKKFSIFFYIVLKCFAFLQLFMLNLTNISGGGDTAIQILRYISTVIFVQEIVTGKDSYKLAVIICGILTLVTIICFIYLIVSVRIGKFFVKLPLSFLNLINVLLLNYFIGPIVHICLLATNCPSGTHIYLDVQCYSDPLHIIFLIVSIINLIFFVSLSVVLSIYYNEIGSINETKLLARINCNYEIYHNISKISMFVFGYFIKSYAQDSKTYQIILQVYLLLTFTLFAFYVYKAVLFYDSRVNNIILYGWVFSAWFSFVIFIKTLLSISDTSIFILLGWLILFGIVYHLQEFKEEHLLTDFNIFEAKSLKEIELFNLKLFNLLNMRSMKNQTLLVGIITKFQEMVKANEELNDKYHKLLNNQHLKKKFNANAALSVLSMVYIIYDHHLEKSFLKNDILLNICYFLVNKFKNIPYTIYLCSKIKAVSHKHLYFKYLLMEEITAFMINKLSKSNNKESIKHIQIGSVILYNIYIDLFKIKKFDSCANQIEYFDLLRNNITTPKTTENFLKYGEEILNLRKEILKLWEKIIELNPFSEEIFKEYAEYLRDIIQDDILLRNETKRYNNFRQSKMSERNSTYHQLFNSNSSVILVDGYLSFGKILYTTPNFPVLYNFSGKEVLNNSIDELVPTVMKDFHKEIIDNAIKFSNIHMIFKDQREFLLKGKTGTIHSIKIYNKSIPNLNFGLIYIANITKMTEHNYIIIADKEFKINSLTDVFYTGLTSGQGFSLDRNVINYHVAVALPDILLQLEYKENIGFYVPKDNIDLKGTLYNVQPHRQITDKVDRVLERIKLNGKVIIDTENINRSDTLNEWDDLENELKSRAMQNNTKPQSIFYKVVPRNFINNYKYFRIYISNDLITMNENTNTNNFNEFPSIKMRKRNNNNGLKDSKIHGKGSDVGQKESQKQIKIRLNHFGSNEEQQKLIFEGQDNQEIEKVEKENNEKVKKDKEEEMSQLSSQNKSAFSKSSVDSASFNKLKNGILEKKEVSAIKLMRYLSFCFGLGTILLVFFASQSSKEVFTNINEFLVENLYFNHSKISVSCLYLATLNFKFVKYGFYNDSRCFIDCNQFYSNMLSTCVSDIKTEKENSTYFYDQFKQILNKEKQITLDLYGFDIKDNVLIDVENNLNLLVVYGLNLNSQLNDFLNKQDTQMDVVSQNILQQSLIYIEDDNISGFNDDEKTSILSSSYFSPINLILIIEACLFVILIMAFIYLIFSLYRLENYYLRKLINFKNSSFEAYLKSLEEIKKKIRNDNGEEDDKVNGDELGQDFQEKSKDDKSKDGDGSNNGKKKTKKKGDKDKDKEDKEEDGEKHRKKKNLRKNKNKAVKNYREEKINVMGKYFLKWNIFFCIKVILILLLSVSYYLVVSLLDQSTQQNMLSFDYTTNAIEGVYKQSFIIYLNLKTELGKYIDFEIGKIKAIDQLANGPVRYYNMTFTSADVLNQTRYYMDLPSSLNTPKIGHLLMPLVNTDLTVAPASIVTLNNLYNVDACKVLFPVAGDYSKCSNFMSSILTKGMEQSITQMSVLVTSVLDDLHSLNNNNKELSSVIAQGGEYNTYEQFVEWYLFQSYMATVQIFRSLNSDNLQQIYLTYQSLMIGYICIVVLLFGFLLYFVYRSKSIFNNFMNFIGILPAKYLIEDAELYREILKLEQHIYY
jgi:hypothetical protein